MVLAGLVAIAALAAFAQEPAGPPSERAESPNPGVTVPPAQAVRPPAEATPSPAPVAIPAVDLPRSRPLEERPEAGPGIGGFIGGSFAVVGCLGGAFLLLRRFGKHSRLLGNAGPIRILARKPLGSKQELLLIEVGPRVFMVGSCRDRLSTLGEFGSPDEVAALRASLPDRRDASHSAEFSQSLREGLREEEAPREQRVFASIADELAEIRRTVRAWRA